MSAVLPELRILAGPALGGRVALASAMMVVGSADDCDIVIDDPALAGHHCRIEASEAGLFVTPLEGRITLDGQEATPDTRMPWLPDAVLGLGYTAFVWRMAYEASPPMTLVPLEMAHLLLGHETAPATPTEAEAAAASPEAEAETPETEEMPTADPDRVGDANEVGGEARLSRRWLEKIGALPPWGRAAAGSGALTLALIFFFGLGQGAGLTAAAVERQAARARFQAGLEALSLRHLRLSTAENGVWRLSGVVDDDAVRQQLYALAETLPVRVALDVKVRRDADRAAVSTLNARGFFPRLGADEDGRRELALYLRDGQAEGRFLTVLREDLPRLLSVRRRVVRATEVAPVLQAELKEEGIADLMPEFLEGGLRLPPVADAERQMRLTRALAASERRLRVPLSIVSREDRPEPVAPPTEASWRSQEQGATRAATTGKNLASPAPERQDVWGDLRVVSVTSGDFPFVTTSDGQKFFPGSTLPDGRATLVGIATDRLTIQRGETTTIYPLEGKTP